MKTETLGSPAEFAAQLATHLAACAQNGLLLPDEHQLRALLEATFYASLHEEEGRRLEFGLAWKPEAGECTAVVAIDAPVRVTPGNLAKLAPATLGDATSIAVRPQGNELVAWALLEHNASARQPLTIRVLTAGVLRVDYAGIPRALYARGEMLFNSAAYTVKSPAQKLSATFAAWNSAGDPRADVVTHIATRALSHGHGGMILIVPREVTTCVGVRVHYPVTRAGALVDSEGRVLRDSAVELVARLTAIDNALLLDTDLRIRGFGVQVIEADGQLHERFEHTDPYSDDVHTDDLSTFKGTRHPAGVLFCMRQPNEAAAIIASQDGNLSLATKGPSGAVDVLGSYVRAFGWT